MNAAAADTNLETQRSEGCADQRLAALEQAQLRERRHRESLPVRDTDGFEASCERSDELQEQMLALPAATREGLAVKFRELVYALRHNVPVEPWIESLFRDLRPVRESRDDVRAA